MTTASLAPAAARLDGARVYNLHGASASVAIVGGADAPKQQAKGY